MIWMVAGVLSLLAWIGLTFLVPVGLGVVHVLLGAGILLFMRGWVEIDQAAAGS